MPGTAGSFPILISFAHHNSPPNYLDSFISTYLEDRGCKAQGGQVACEGQVSSFRLKLPLWYTGLLAGPTTLQDFSPSYSLCLNILPLYLHSPFITSSTYFFKCHLLREAFPNPFIKIKLQHSAIPHFPHFVFLQSILSLSDTQHILITRMQVPRW